MREFKKEDLICLFLCVVIVAFILDLCNVTFLMEQSNNIVSTPAPTPVIPVASPIISTSTSSLESDIDLLSQSLESANVVVSKPLAKASEM